MDRKQRKKRERTKRINKLRNMVQNNASDQDRLDINPESYKILGHDENGDPIVLKKTLDRDSYEAIFNTDSINPVVNASRRKFDLKKSSINPEDVWASESKAE